MRTSFPFPDSVVQSRIWLERPGIRGTDSPYTGHRYEMDYGGARWAGITHIGARDGDDGRQVEAWIAEWIAGILPGEMPIQRAVVELAGSTTVTAYSGGKVTLSRDLVGDPIAGLMVRLGNRTYMSTGHTSKNEFWVSPKVDPGLVTVAPGRFVKVRPNGRIELSRTPDRYGPWTIPWIELPT